MNILTSLCSYSSLSVVGKSSAQLWPVIKTSQISRFFNYIRGACSCSSFYLALFVMSMLEGLGFMEAEDVFFFIVP